MPIKRQSENNRHKQSMPYATSEMLAIMQYVEREMNDPSLIPSMHFSSTALTVAHRVMMSEGMIITDSTLCQAGIDEYMSAQLKLQVNCFIDEPRVVTMAEQRHTTRAEIAIDYALGIPGPKLIVIGSAPAALERLIKRRQLAPITDVVVLAAPTGFANVIQLKERIWEIDIPSIVVRGRKGGAAVSAAITNAMLIEVIKQKNL